MYRFQNVYISKYINNNLTTASSFMNGMKCLLMILHNLCVRNLSRITNTKRYLAQANTFRQAITTVSDELKRS